MKNKEFVITLTIICFILGLMVAMQLKTVKINSEIDSNRANVQTQYAELKRDYDAKILEIEEKDKMLEEYRKAETDEETVNILKQELNKAMQDACLTNVRGAGVIVTMDDSIKTIEGITNLNLYLVHDEDILKVVNELRGAGAEAISVNGQRIISTSEIRCAGNTIFINGERVGAPFIINAIGDPALLESAMLMRGGYVDSLKEFGLRITTSRETDVVVPKYKKAISSKFLTTVVEEPSVVHEGTSTISKSKKISPFDALIVKPE